MFDFITIAFLNLLATATPGPDFALVIKNSLLYQRRIAMITVLGIVSGEMVHISYCILGLAFVITHSKVAFDIIRYLGGAYMVYIGIKALLVKREEWTNIAKKFWQKAGVAHKIELHIAPALQTLDQLLSEGHAESFDFAFIDADKNKYPLYFEKTLFLIKRGGVIAIDNIFLNGRVIDLTNKNKNVKTLQEFNKKLFRDIHVKLTTIPIGDGLSLVKKI